MRNTHKSRVFAVGVMVALAATACSSGGGTPSSNNASGPVTLTWWHNGTTDPLLSLWQQVVSDYHAQHPNVTIKINPIQNEQFTTKVPLALQSSDPPDIYQQWGGGDEASQITSGKVADITPMVSSWISELGSAADGWQVNGKQYGVPYDLHAVGFWYRTDIFSKAGITSPPKTIDELVADNAKLKAAGVTPIAIGSKDKWPDAFYWDYFTVRECSTNVLKQSVKSIKLADPCWTKAGADLKSFLATNPFQNGFLGTPAQQGAGSSAGMLANGQAGMELQGDWELSTMAALTTDKTLNSKLGWFPFPTVSGGAGSPDTILGGGDGFSCTTKQAAACADFLKYISSTAVQSKFVGVGGGLPANPAATSSLTDPTLKAVFQARQTAGYTEMYYDKAFPTNVGAALNDSIANYFAGQGSPQTMVNAVSQAASGGK